jgi:hypothetical protein
MQFISRDKKIIIVGLFIQSPVFAKRNMYNR